jgi:pimeloyl-ACP methyl ester carboxylesterase
MRCAEKLKGARLVRFDSETGVQLGGAILGTGPAGVVLVHGSLADLCEWLPFAGRFPSDEFTVLAIDLNGFGSSPPSATSPRDPHYDLDAQAGVATLRSAGVRSVALVGESIGGTAVILAGAALDPPVNAVVDLSGPAEISGMDAAAAAPALTMPVLFVRSERDGDDDGIERVIERTRPRLAKTEVVPGNRHGISLLDPLAEPEAERLQMLVIEFIRGHARP